MHTIINSEDAPLPPPPEPPQKAEPSHEGAAATATKPAPPRVEHLPPFRVLLHSDDHNSFDWVVDSITQITPHNRERALVLMWEAHSTGVSLLLVTHKERAELYVDQFKTKNLTVTIEPAE